MDLNSGTRSRAATSNSRVWVVVLPRMFQQDASNLQHGQRMLMHVEMVRGHDQLGFGVVQMSAGVGHDAVAFLVAGSQEALPDRPGRRGDADDGMVMDAGRRRARG